MPELPEVETIVRELIATGLVGKQIATAYVQWPKIIDTSDDQVFIHQIQGQSINNLARRGKYLVFTLSQSTLFVHLRMSGKFEWLANPLPIKKHEHVRLVFTDGTILRYEDPRKFGRWSLYSDPLEKLSRLGLEPLSSNFTCSALTSMLQRYASQIKPFLLNQKHIVGLGNIYVDEALWEAKINPQQLTNSLTKKEIKALHQAIQNVLNKGIENKGTSLGVGASNYYSVSGRRGGHQHHLKVFRQQGLACSRCSTLIIKIVVAQRGTHLCPTCQKSVIFNEIKPL
ncbi:Formamidopyrimidine-DNA glycosylase [Neochlamydia sp. TUME1]|uniref:DNA-formamidopyrimidine glycosylase n=1 Tax=Neochlamydia sp. TUME1 TaxID=1478174 RepID=UPI00057D503C|nr:DNA-formamidopyrimidine glycosylase [Neochlamydia sp. TUME1]KIC76448.1 Formamidopyrimidine-DNA glycosylase [Neochlamydia sp. TUME1]